MSTIIPADPLHEILRLCRRFELGALYLFGSRAQEIDAWLQAPAGPLSPSTSDIDVGVHHSSAQEISVRDKVQFAQALEALFQEQRVDLVLLDEVDPFLAANIIRGIRLYAADDDAADEYELYILRRTADLAHFERQRQAMILEVEP